MYFLLRLPTSGAAAATPAEAVVFGTITVQPTVDFGEMPFDVSPAVQFGTITVRQSVTFGRITITPVE